MTVSLAPPIVFQSFLPNGAPNAFGTVATYIAGTTTAQATWTDATQTTQNQNPTPLNASGQASIWFGSTLVYKIIVFDALGNQINFQDQVYGGSNLGSVSTSIIPTPDNTLTLGNVTNSWANAYLGPNHAPVLDSVSGNIGYYARTAAEIAAGVTPTNFSYAPGDVRRYGATGNGSADDSAAFANAALICGTHPMLIPYTSTGYKVTTPFALPANASMIGLGRPQIFATTNGTHICSATNVTGSITIQGIRFLGTSASTVPLSGFGGFAAANTGLLTVTTCSNVRITDCDFSTFYNGLCVQGSTRVWAQRNKVDTFQSTGISMPSTTEFEVEFNDISNCTQAGGVVAYGVQCTGNQAGGSAAQFNSVSFNRILGIPSWDAIGTHDIDGLRIIGNDCRNVRHGIDVGHLVNTNVVQNITIANNYVEGPTNDTWGGAAAEIAGIVIAGFDATHRVAGCTVTGNTIKNFFNVSGMVGGGNGAGCISIANADDVNVTGNTIANCATLSGGAVIPQSTGIYATGTCNRLTIGPNSIQGNTFNRGGVRTNGLTFDVLTIVGNAGIYVTTTTAHVSHLTGAGGILNVGVNPTNSTVPYSESGSTCTGSSNQMLAGAGNTATAVSTGSTIPTAFGFVQCTVAAASTGNILTAGTGASQECVILNASGANTITMAAAGTSNVADGASCIIGTNTYKRFVWNAATSLWYHA